MFILRASDVEPCQVAVLQDKTNIVGAAPGTGSAEIHSVEGGFDNSPVIAQADDLFDGLLGELSPFRVNVHQENGGVRQSWESQDITDELAGESKDTNADESDFDHVSDLPLGG